MTASIVTKTFSGKALGLNYVFTEASVTALPFFQHHGFILLTAQEVVHRGLVFLNYKMERSLEPIHTGRLIVRHFTEMDLPDLLAYQTHPETLKYLPPEPMDKEKAKSFLARQADLETWAGDGWLAFAVYHPGDGKVIGEVGVFVEKEPKSEGNIGWMLHPDYHGQGYAAEAAQTLVQYAFQERHLHRLTSGCDARNTASWRLMERLGMRREGHFRQSSLLRGEWQDEYLYALLRDEWLTPQAPGQSQPPPGDLSPG